MIGKEMVERYFATPLTRTQSTQSWYKVIVKDNATQTRIRMRGLISSGTQTLPDRNVVSSEAGAEDSIHGLATGESTMTAPPTEEMTVSDHAHALMEHQAYKRRCAFIGGARQAILTRSKRFRDANRSGTMDWNALELAYPTPTPGAARIMQERGEVAKQ